MPSHSNEADEQKDLVESNANLPSDGDHEFQVFDSTTLFDKNKMEASI